MKTLKQLVFPMIIFMIGISLAFATNAKNSENSMLETGYRFDPSASTIKCIATSVQCAPTGGPICTWKDANNVSHNLMKYVNNTTCGTFLYRGY
ncbi:MAG TPA: DUF6520 family protein [Flavobacterium sp.]|nr:DUF6520 family protein [Flavobacterium sp.]